MVIERLDVAVQDGPLAAFRLGGAQPEATTPPPTVLAIHGITSNSRSWLAVARELGPRASLVAVDLRGRAASARLPGPFGIERHVRDLLAVLDRLGLERAVIAGHSLGAYVAQRLATLHPDRVARLVLVDGGLSMPLPAGADPEAVIEGVLGPAVARLAMTFANGGAYRDWWAHHPAIAAGDVDGDDLAQYAAHDLTGEPPALRCAVNPQVVRDDGIDVLRMADASAITVPAILLSAPRGMVDDPNPVQPMALVQAWVAADPGRRRSELVPDTNHYTIVLGGRGARAVAAAIADAVAATR